MLVQKLNGSWSFPGGKQEKDERAKTTARRECKEETGIVPRRATKIGERKHPISDRRICYIWFDAHAGRLKNKEPDKHQYVQWVPIESLEEYLGDGVFENVAQRLKDHLRSLQK